MLRCCYCSAAPASQMESSIASLSSATMPAFFFFVLLLFPAAAAAAAAASRRVIHQPFFPIISQPPAEPPVSSFPKYPSSTNPQQPFFPFFPSPPPPPDAADSGTPSSSVPTFPANISSLILPHSNSAASPSSRSGKLVPTILLPLLALAFLVLALAFFHHRRRRLVDDKAFRSDAHRLFPTDTATSDGRNHSISSAPTSSEFLYLGTLVNSRAAAAVAAPPKPAAPSPVPRIGSPELRPLPPLSRQFRRGYGNADPGCSSEEEFYSPRASSSAGRESPGERGPCSRRVFIPAVMLERCGPPRSSTLSTPSYPSSNSASSPAPSSPRPCSSPEKSTVKSSDSRSDGGIAEEVIMRSPPPPPPSRPLTPSPPKRKPHYPSPPSSPADKDPERTLKCADLVSQKLRSPAKIGDFARCPSHTAPPPPPTPPPPPPAGYWKAKVLPSQPPILVSPRPIALKCAAAFRPAESPRVSDAGERNNEETIPRPKLKPLHWDKVRASSDRVMVWDQLKSSSFQLNEEMIETLFVCNATNATPKETARRQVLPPPNMESKVLDPKKSQNIAILLRALNVTKEEVCEALLEGNVDSLDAELLETLLKMAPTKEEERKLKEYKDDSPFKLGPAEKFLKAVLDIPFAFKRVDAMLYIANFDSEVNYLKRSFETLEAACDELRSSRMFLKLLEAVLKTGNRMNVGTNRGDAHAFKLDTLLKLVDVKGTDGKTTLLHFVVQEIIRSEGSRLAAANHQAQPSSRNQTCTLREDLECKKLGLQIVAGLGGELSNVKKAATMDSEVLSSSVSKLAGGVGRVGEVVRLNGSPESNPRLHEGMSEFLKKAEDDIIKIQAQESVASSLVKEITEYFHGNSAKEEAHPFRIFMVVRDFLSILDQVCKEVGKINERTFVSSARQFPVPVNPTLPPVFPRLRPHTAGSSDDDGESSSSSPSQ